MNYFKLSICILVCIIGLNAATILGHAYEVTRPDSPYAAVEGDMQIHRVGKGTRVRLIKDETVAETLLFAPLRIIKIMVNIEPRGNWLVEDESGNRGYMWDSDLTYLKR